MGTGISEPRIVAKGSGWRVHRIGRSFCVQIDRGDEADPLELWMRRTTDAARSSAIGQLAAGGHGDLVMLSALEAMGADW